MKIVAIISMAVLFGFIGISIWRYSLLESYSAYAEKWDRGNGLNVWQIATFIAGILLIPGMIEIGEGNSFQFVGFITPLYLIGVGCTPNWAKDKHEFRLHMIFAMCCTAGAIAWIIFIAKMWYVAVPVSIAVIALSLITRSLKTCYTLWLEVIMYLSTYLVLLLS